MDNFFTRQRRRRQEANALYDLWFSVIPGPAPSGPLPSGRSSAGGPSLVARGPVPARSMTADELEAVQAEQREAVFDFIIERGLVSDEYWVVEGVDRLDARDGLGSHQSAPVRLAVDGAATAEACEGVLRQFEERNRAHDVLDLVTAAVATEEHSPGSRQQSTTEPDIALTLSVTAGEEDFATYVEIAATTSLGTGDPEARVDEACQDLRGRVWGWIADHRILDDGYQLVEAAHHRSNPAGGFGDRSVWGPDAGADEERLAEIRELVEAPGALEWSAGQLRSRDPEGRKANRTLLTTVKDDDDYGMPSVTIM